MLPVSGVSFTVALDGPVGVNALGISVSFGVMKNAPPGVSVSILRDDFGRGPELPLFPYPESIGNFGFMLIGELTSGLSIYSSAFRSVA